MTEFPVLSVRVCHCNKALLCAIKLTDHLHDLARGSGRQNAVALQTVGAATRRHDDYPQSEVGQQREDCVLS